MRAEAGRISVCTYTCVASTSLPRGYQREAPNRCVFTDEHFKGASKRKAASQVGFEQNNLRKRLKTGKTATSIFFAGHQEQENDIYEYI